MAVSTTAKTKKDVDEMTREEQLWDSLSYNYGKKGEQLESEYNKAISQQDRALLGRGMQRSSAGMSTLAGLRNQRTKALDDNNSQLISTYEDRLQAIKDAEDARAYQTSEREAQQEWQAGQTKLAQEFQAAQAALDREQNQSQFDTNLAYNREKDALAQSNYEKEFAYKQEQDAIAQAFNEKQWEAQQAQWREEFDYNKMSDEQKLAYNYVVSILENGGDPSDELLAKAGLSRADANAMKTNARSSGYYTPKSGNDETGNETGDTDSRLKDLLNGKRRGTASTIPETTNIWDGLTVVNGGIWDGLATPSTNIATNTTPSTSTGAASEKASATLKSKAKEKTKKAVKNK